MLTLIRKDLLLHKPAYLGFTPAAVIYLGWFASRIDSPVVYATFAGIFACVLPLVLVAREDVYQAEAFVCSLPVTRGQVVHARYIISWSLALVFTVIGLVLYATFASAGSGAIWSVSVANRSLLTLAVGLGVALPFAIRFGWFGLTVFGIGMQLLGIAAYFIVSALASRLPLGDAFAAIAESLAAIQASLGGPLFLAAVASVLVIFNLVSCKIAVTLFARREL